jgi:AcrR family transcriptional regulator
MEPARSGGAPKPFQDTRPSTVPNFMPIPGDSHDARAVRTRGDLASALVALMHERGFDDISVSDICARANVGRSTFYAHFEDKEEMFIRHTVVFARSLGESLSWDAAANSWRFPVAHTFEHVRKMKPVMDSLAKANKRELIFKIWHNNIAEGFEHRVVQIRANEKSAIPAAILAQQLAGTLMTLLTWWMDHHQPLDPAEMERQWTRLVAGLR